MKTIQTQKIKLNIEIKQMTSKTNQIIHHNVQSSEGAYNESYDHIKLRATTQIS